jgi:ADP-heptose:LPS heptosyltransferase
MKWINWKEKSKLVASMITSRLINSFRNPSLLSYSNILVIKNDEIGDMCYSLHVFAMLRKQYPNARMTVFCKAYALPLLSADPSINTLVTSWQELKGNFDLIVDLKVSWRSMMLALKHWPKARLDRGTVRFADAFLKVYPHETETNFKVVAPVIAPENRKAIPELTISADDEHAAENLILQHKLSHFALLHISARRELRKWPAERYQALAEYLHHEMKMQIVFIGGNDETADIDLVRGKLSFPSYSTAGVLTLGALGALMKKAQIFIGNESGPLHIAALMKLPCIGLYGPGPQHVFYPIGKKSAYLHHVLPCNPCDQIHCVHPENPCIKRITLDEVKEKTRMLLQEG